MLSDEAVTLAYRNAIVGAINTEGAISARLAGGAINPQIVVTALLVTASEFAIENCARPGCTFKASTVISGMVDSLLEVAAMLAAEGK